MPYIAGARRRQGKPCSRVRDLPFGAIATSTLGCIASASGVAAV
ncbi:MAG TPA: hypothetical protein VE780_12985 [Thermoleophilaceae bacterium]|nr:hypothetical protein [Thermoleophilaceae bacterium]